jgi:hypothetical protein
MSASQRKKAFLHTCFQPKTPKDGLDWKMFLKSCRSESTLHIADCTIFTLYPGPTTERHGGTAR